MVDDVAILGVGMHPWGKWGRNFVEYGVAAAPRRARRRRHRLAATSQFVAGADTMRNGYPGYVAGATFAQALGWTGVPVAIVLRRLRVGRQAHRRRPRAHPRRPVRRRARRRCRHHAEGLPRPQRGRARRRPRLAALPPARRDQPDLLRPVRPAPHGPLRRHRGGLRPGQGEERAARPRQPERPLPQGVHASRTSLASPIVADPLRLLDICATSDGGAAMVLASIELGRGARRTPTPVRIAGVSTVTPDVPRTR